MEFRHLRYFLVLAEELNFSRAAERLHMTQPPLTRQIQQLEEAVGAQLFLRTPRGLFLTEAGFAFLDEAKKLQFLADQAIVRTQLASRGEVGQIDVGMFGSAIFSIIPTLLTSFRRSHPQVTVSLHTMTKAQQIEALRERRLSVGFNRVFHDVPDLVVETVLHESMAVALHEDHPLAVRSQLSIGDLADEPLVLYPNVGRPSFADTVVALCRQAGFSPRVALEVEDAVTAVALVSSGFGLCVVPESATSLLLPQVLYRSLYAPGTSIELNCIYRRDDPSPTLQAFLAQVRQLRGQMGERLRSPVAG